jgi:hypothetical protein
MEPLTRLIPLSTSTNSDTDDLSFRRLRFVARAFCALSAALLVALIAVSIALAVSSSKASAMPTPAVPAVAPKFTIAREAFGQYTRVLIRNEGAYAVALLLIAHEVSYLSLPFPAFPCLSLPFS